MLRAPTWAEVEQGAREAVAKDDKAMDTGHPVPRTWNTEVATTLAEKRFLAWDERGYWVQPVPFHLGGRLYDLQLRLMAIHRKRVDRQAEVESIPATNMDLEGERQDMREEVAVATECVEIFRHLVSPAGWWRRLWWRMGLVRNPFRNATAQEVAELLGFFCWSRTASRAAGSATRAVGRTGG
jgi:hypothetical protein